MEIVMNEDDFIVSKTDKKGCITYGNEIFIKMSGYSEKELLGAPHNLLRDEDMPSVVFQLLWERIQGKSTINAFVKNRCKNGDFYWVFANVTPSFDSKGNIIGYYSVRRKPKDKALEVIKKLYAQLRAVEKAEGVKSSETLLRKVLDEKGVSYDEFIISLQK